MKRLRHARSGFTLVELAIAVVIVGILAAIALPSYTDFVRKGRRADAFDAMAWVQQEQERYRSNNQTYTSSFVELKTSSQSPAGHYSLALSDASALGYTLTVTPAEGSKQAQDDACVEFKVRVFKASSERKAKNKNGVDSSAACLPQ